MQKDVKEMRTLMKELEKLRQEQSEWRLKVEARDAVIARQRL